MLNRPLAPTLTQLHFFSLEFCILFVLFGVQSFSMDFKISNKCVFVWCICTLYQNHIDNIHNLNWNWPLGCDLFFRFHSPDSKEMCHFYFVSLSISWHYISMSICVCVCVTWFRDTPKLTDKIYRGWSKRNERSGKE